MHDIVLVGMYVAEKFYQVTDRLAMIPGPTFH